MKKPVDFDWYCKTKKDVINNAAYELIVALTAKSAPPRKFELSIPQRDDEMIANVVEGAINAVEAQIGYYCHPFYQEADMLPCYLRFPSKNKLLSSLLTSTTLSPFINDSHFCIHLRIFL